MTFLETPSGLMIESVRSSAMGNISGQAGRGTSVRGPRITEKPASKRGFSRYGCSNSTGSGTPLAPVSHASRLTSVWRRPTIKQAFDSGRLHDDHRPFLDQGSDPRRRRRIVRAIRLQRDVPAP